MKIKINTKKGKATIKFLDIKKFDIEFGNSKDKKYNKMLKKIKEYDTDDDIDEEDNDTIDIPIFEKPNCDDRKYGKDFMEKVTDSNNTKKPRLLNETEFFNILLDQENNEKSDDKSSKGSCEKPTKKDTKEETSNMYNPVYLGDSVSTEQYKNIAEGNFNGLPIGGFWRIHDRVFRIMAHDQYYGYNGIKKHHLVIMSDGCYTKEPYVDDAFGCAFDIEKGSYIDSNVAYYLCEVYDEIITTIFGEKHILEHIHDMPSEYDDLELTPDDEAKSWLINSYNLDGKKYANELAYKWKREDKIQFPAFKYNEKLKKSNVTWWLCTASNISKTEKNMFCAASKEDGKVISDFGHKEHGIRPAFLLC